MKKIIIVILAFCISLLSVTANENKVLNLEAAIKMYEGRKV